MSFKNKFKPIWLIFLFTYINASIKDVITQKYEESYPTINIKQIKVKEVPYKNIDTRFINTKRNYGTILITTKENTKRFLRYKIDATIIAPVTKYKLQRNHKLSADDIKLKEIKFKNFYSYPINIENINKYITKRIILKDKIIYQNDVRMAYDINKYAKIKAIDKTSSIEIIIQATALRDGNIGDIIPIKIGNKRYQARIISKNMVEIL